MTTATRSTDPLAACNVCWRSPSANSGGLMPIGNGDLALGVWVESGGDVMLYVGKNDSWSENARLLKLARVRISLTPVLPVGSKFRQELQLARGQIAIEAGRGRSAVSVVIRVDAHSPVAQVEVRSQRAVDVSTTLEVWRTRRRQIRGKEMWSAWGLWENPAYKVFVEPDTICPADADRLTWYHRNERSCYGVTMRKQSLEKLMASLGDPLLGRTFGGCIEGPGLVATDDRTLVSSRARKSHRVSIHALTAQTRSAGAWLRALTRQVAKTNSHPPAAALRAHRKWWKDFWQRSWIHVSGAKDAAGVTSGYVLQRWLVACSGRGPQPIKWNGATFTFDTQWAAGGPWRYDADFRRWGGCYWFQNTRQVYWPMLPAGDYDLMTAWFGMYRDALPLARARTKIYYNHSGAFFPETMYFWGAYGNRDYGWDRKGVPVGLATNTFIARYWQGGIEVVACMLDYWDQTRDSAFARETLLPVAEAIATFYARHWPRDTAGKIHFKPSQALETYHDAVNPLPEIAGLRFILPRLIAMPASLTSPSKRRAWQRLLDEMPQVPTRQTPSGPVLAAAEFFTDQGNEENVALYALFPYRLYGVGKPGLELALRTWRNRGYKTTGCWRQESVHAAAVGKAADARRYVRKNFSNTSSYDEMKHIRPSLRFPANWCTGDWVPDLDHGGVASIGLQRMLMQCEPAAGSDQAGQIRLLPAWPKAWDVDFKLHAPLRTVVEGTVKGGRVTKLKVTPVSRRKDVVIMKPQ